MPSIHSYNKRLTALESERSSFEDIWRDLSEYIIGYRGRFQTSNRNEGYHRNQRVINNTPFDAQRVLAAGMMSGITSPARPWFRLASSDPEINDSTAVKTWLHDVELIMYRIFSQSNTYQSLNQLYTELSVFGTGAMGVYQDFDNVIRCNTYTAGSYYLAKNGLNEIDSFYRKYERPVSAVVKEFGLDKMPEWIQQAWNSGNTETWVRLVHVVEPNDNRDMQSPLANNMPYRSVYYDYGGQSYQGGENVDKDFLRVSGFNDMPILTPRWDLTTEDIYGVSCPGMVALNDCKTLQLGERRAYQALDKVANPPLQAPATLRNKLSGNTLNSNELLWVNNTNEEVRSIYGSWRPDLNAMSAYNDKAEARIKRAMYYDLFLSLLGDQRNRQVTAREVAERHEEKLLMLGPVLERLHKELLDPLIDRTFNIAQEAGIFPPPPPELADTELSVQYVSVLAQAQQMVNTNGIDALAAFTGNISGVWSEARHKVNAMQLVDDYAEAVGVNPRSVVSDADAIAAADAEAQAAQQQAAMEQAAAMAQAGKTASEINLDGDNPVAQAAQNLGLA